MHGYGASVRVYAGVRVMTLGSEFCMSCEFVDRYESLSCFFRSPTRARVWLRPPPKNITTKNCYINQKLTCLTSTISTLCTKRTRTKTNTNPLGSSKRSEYKHKQAEHRNLTSDCSPHQNVHHQPFNHAFLQ